ncbi:hypothetical protein FB45DRAFT_922699 [Roridomyces roridus]|uniref:F-box domain-containing protein n=1 Tax=Roridomyces roridus TaxID=1738132 RepID=A0AAD7BNJ4_9AGAR|nr:hypothetical protein FB45DRAFT_922699 [Roridomyces roridus]
MSPPRLPPELIDLILGHGSDSRRDMLACALVCRDWLVFARGRLVIRIDSRSKAALFIALIQAPTTTLPATISQLVLAPAWGETPGILPILPMLSNFPALRSLTLYFIHLTNSLPTLPSLTKLTLASCGFPAYSGFICCLAKHPQLRDLVFSNCTVYRASAEERKSLPTVNLDTLVLDGNDIPTDSSSDLCLLRTRKLTFQRQSPDVVSIFLHRLGTHLTHLCLLPDVPSTLTFIHTTHLTHLKIQNVFGFGYGIDANAHSHHQSFRISPHLHSLLGRITPHNVRLRTLIFHAMRASNRGLRGGTVTCATELLGQLGLEELPELRLIVRESGVMNVCTKLRAVIRGCTGRTTVVGIVSGRVVARSGQQ